MSELQTCIDSACMSSQERPSSPQSSTEVSSRLSTLWFLTTFVTVMVVLGVVARDPLQRTFSMHSKTSSVKLFLSDNLRGSPAIGAPQSDEDDQYYEWNVISKTIHKTSAVSLLLSESLTGSPAIGAPALNEGEDDQVYFDDDISFRESSEELTNLERKEDLLRLWNNEYQVDNAEFMQDEFSEDNGDDLMDVTAMA